jgi:hypothetical protein
MFIAQSTTQIALPRSAMSSTEVISFGLWYDLEQKSAVDDLHSSPTERNMVQALSYKHRTPPE